MFLEAMTVKKEKKAATIKKKVDTFSPLSLRSEDLPAALGYINLLSLSRNRRHMGNNILVSFALNSLFSKSKPTLI